MCEKSTNGKYLIVGQVDATQREHVREIDVLERRQRIVRQHQRAERAQIATLRCVPHAELRGATTKKKANRRRQAGEFVVGDRKRL